MSVNVSSINVSVVVALEETHSRYFLSSRKLSGDHKLVVHGFV